LDKIRVFYRYSCNQLEEFLTLAKLNTRMPKVIGRTKRSYVRKQKKGCRKTKSRAKAREDDIFKSTMHEAPQVVKPAIKYKKDQEIIFI
jgi:hypothetical protein